MAQALLGRAVAEDALIVGISGRYEFKNKGLDVFVEALGRLNRDVDNKRDILRLFWCRQDIRGQIWNY